MKHEPLTTDDLNACYDLKDSLKIPALNKAQWCQVQDSSPFCSAFFECLVQLLLTSLSKCVGELPPVIVGKDNLVQVLGRTSCSRKVTTALLLSLNDIK